MNISYIVTLRGPPLDSGFYGFLDFFWIFFWGFLSKLLRLLLKVTKVTTGHQKLEEEKKGPKQHNKLSFFARRAKKDQQSSVNHLVTNIGYNFTWLLYKLGGVGHIDNRPFNA